MGFLSMAMGEGKIVNGGKLSWAEMLSSIPAFVENLIAALGNEVYEKLGINHEWISNTYTGFAALIAAPLSLMMYEGGTIIDLGIDAYHKLMKFLEPKWELAKKLTKYVLDCFETAINNLKNWFNNNFNPGYKYAASHPSIKVDTINLRNYAGRLRKVNQRLGALDLMLDSLYLRAGLSDLWTLMQADLLTGESWTINRIIAYLEDTAANFETAERNISSHI